MFVFVRTEAFRPYLPLPSLNLFCFAAGIFDLIDDDPSRNLLKLNLGHRSCDPSDAGKQAAVPSQLSPGTFFVLVTLLRIRTDKRRKEERKKTKPAQKSPRLWSQPIERSNTTRRNSWYIHAPNIRYYLQGIRLPPTKQSAPLLPRAVSRVRLAKLVELTAVPKELSRLGGYY